MPSIRYFSETVSFKLNTPRKTTAWIREALAMEEAKLDSINVVFCSDQYLFEVNKSFLKQKALTDIITFNFQDGHAELYISIDRIRYNSAKLKVSFENELNRVLIHGILHLAGYSDNTKPQKAIMRKKEEVYLSLL